MKFSIKEIVLGLFILFSICAIKAQERNLLPSPSAENGTDCVLFVDSKIVRINFSVWSNKGGYLKNLTQKDFEIYDENEFKKIEFFEFDKLKNQYSIEYLQSNSVKDNEWRDLKIRLSEDKKRNFGKVIINSPKGYYVK